jgi:3',5'-cyclic AMP phosphodiesterase CpdA
MLLAQLSDTHLTTGVLAGPPAERAHRALLGRLGLPVHVVPGNHDHAPRMLQALAGDGYVQAAADEPGRCY